MTFGVGDFFAGVAVEVAEMDDVEVAVVVGVGVGVAVEVAVEAAAVQATLTVPTVVLPTLAVMVELPAVLLVT
ncbi:MAG: hypothetical protein AAB834_06770 [Patescibacteria group bacterium]